MSTIRCVYFGGAPGFPATDQHPDAVRYVVGPYVVDAVGSEPTLVEVEKVLGRDPVVAIDAQLAALDATTLKGIRGLREFILVQAQVTDALIENGFLEGSPISDNEGIKKIRQVEEAAVALRAQRKALTG